MTEQMTPEHRARLLADVERIRDLVQGPWAVPDRRDMEALTRIVRDVPALATELARWEGHDAITATLVKQAEAERDRLAEQVQRVREKHSPIAAHVGDPDDDDNLVTACGECEVPYPCPTIRALDGTGDGS